MENILILQIELLFLRLGYLGLLLKLFCLSWFPGIAISDELDKVRWTIHLVRVKYRTYILIQCLNERVSET